MPQGWPDWNETAVDRLLPFAIDAIIMQDGTWHDVWDANDLRPHPNREKRICWYETFRERFLDRLAPDTMLYTFDCNI